MNYFQPYTVAQRYALGRPDFHGITMKHIITFLQLNRQVEKALDIACGTGLSTQALLSLAKQVYGTDSSQHMLEFALRRDKIQYQIANAENQPFQDNEFDLITVCSGVHWFNIDTFLKESNRLLKNEGYLVLYDNFFLANMLENPAFKHWHDTTYFVKFPAPPRNNQYAWTTENLLPNGFNLAGEDNFNNTINFNKGDLILYLTTQSNIIAKVENKVTTYLQIEDWLDRELDKFFPDNTYREDFQFGNWVKYLRKTEA